MASRKLLKANINAVCFDIIDECLTLHDFENVSEEKIRPLLNDAIQFRNDLITRFGKARKSENAAAEYKKMELELDEKTLEFIDRLNELQ
ncbi:MAG: hypothetical protein K1X56_09610 [Flavobacteriales bacterium]|nr:hypothetical protein [Flavobacteriales bacterium]